MKKKDSNLLKSKRELNIDVLNKSSLKWLKNHFGGPSVYFHEECLKLAKNRKTRLTKKHIIAMYAVLTAWGMHRIGEHTQLTDFENFESALKSKTFKDALRKYINEKNIKYKEEKIKIIFKELEKKLNKAKQS